MTNAELIKALRNCEVHGNGGDCRKECPYVDQDCGACIHEALLLDAADALEAAEKRIAELEAQLLKEGECEFVRAYEAGHSAGYQKGLSDGSSDLVELVSRVEYYLSHEERKDGV